MFEVGQPPCRTAIIPAIFVSSPAGNSAVYMIGYPAKLAAMEVAEVVEPTSNRGIEQLGQLFNAKSHRKRRISGVVWLSIFCLTAAVSTGGGAAEL